MSRHWPWFPSEGHTDTGCLCSAGSGRSPVPRRPRSYAALRLPASFGRGSGSPCRRPTSLRALVLCLCGRRHVRSQTCRASETGHRLSARPGMGRGEARASQVTRPSSSYVPWSNTPPDTIPSSPTTRRGRCSLQVIQHPGHPGRLEVSGPHAPWPARSHAYASPTPFLTPSQGWLPAQAGSPLAGRVLHPLDDRQSFMKVSHPPIPFDQQGLVALNFLSAPITTSNQRHVPQS
jgi:hypothetical protein